MIRFARLRKVIALIAVNAFGLVLAFGVAEVGSRLRGMKPRGVTTGDRGVWRYEPMRGWGLTPGASGEDYRGGPNRGRIRINPQGFRGVPFARSKGRGSRRVLVVGDSFAFGVGVDEENTMPALLETLINGDRELTNGAHVDVLNLGVSGYSTDQELLTFQAEGAPLDPDVVVLLMCDNDFDGNTQTFMYNRYYKPRYILEEGVVLLRDSPAPRAERRRPVRTWLFDHSAFYGALARYTDNPRSRDVARFLAAGASDAFTGSKEELMAALLRRFHRDVRQIGATLVTFNTGHRGEETPLFQRLRPELERAGIEHLGLEAAMTDARRRHPELAWDFGEDTHWNVASNYLAARVIHQHLRKLAREGKIHLAL